MNPYLVESPTLKNTGPDYAKLAETPGDRISSSFVATNTDEDHCTPGYITNARDHLNLGLDSSQKQLPTHMKSDSQISKMYRFAPEQHPQRTLIPNLAVDLRRKTSDPGSPIKRYVTRLERRMFPKRKSRARTDEDAQLRATVRQFVELRSLVQFALDQKDTSISALQTCSLNSATLRCLKAYSPTNSARDLFLGIKYFLCEKLIGITGGYLAILIWDRKYFWHVGREKLKGLKYELQSSTTLRGAVERHSGLYKEAEAEYHRDLRSRLHCRIPKTAWQSTTV